MKNMTPTVLIIILILGLLAMCYVVSGDSNVPDEEVVAVCDVVVEDTPLEPLPEIAIDSFSDPNINNYTLEELLELITYYEQIKINTENIINAVKALNWHGEDEIVNKATVEKENSIIILDVYQTAYHDKLNETLMDNWEVKLEEYPVATEIWLYMKALGWSDYVCAGIMGNMMAEAGGQTLNIQYKAYNSTNFFYGICQWSKRYYGEIHGADLLTQCDFLRDTIEYEFNTFGDKYKYGFNFEDFLAMSNVREVALAFAKCYERCGTGSYNVRKNNAEAAYNYFVN